MPSEKPATIVLYALAASLAACTLVYIFGPTLFPENDESRSKSHSGAVGLVNPGNDCFINSVLQALSGVESLKAYLRKETLIYEEANEDSEEKYDRQEATSQPSSVNRLSKSRSLVFGIVTRALSHMVNRLSSKSTLSKTISARDFIRTLEHAFGQVISRRQQDAQEFLQIVLERLDDELQARVKQAVPLPDSSTGSDDDRAPYQGRTVSQIECMICHYKPQPTSTAFSMLSLNVPQQASTTLDACLDGMFKLETIDGYKCLLCTVQETLEHYRQNVEHDSNAGAVEKAMLRMEAVLATNAPNPEQEEEFWRNMPSLPRPPNKRRCRRHMYISSYPKLLIIHLSRSMFDTSALSMKNHAKVSFPEILTLGSFEPRKFRLASLVTHRGGHESGHYETFKRTEGDEPPTSSADSVRRRKRRAHQRWWRISDDRIAECTLQDVLDMQGQAYLLFYESMNA